MIFIISDYSEFDKGNFDKIQFTAYEIWNQSERSGRFREILKNYYEKIYKPKVNNLETRKGSIAPLNFWPYQYNFYMSNPIRTFHATIDYSKPKENAVDIDFYIEPNIDRNSLKSELMPSSLLRKDDKKILGLDSNDKFTQITEKQRKNLPLRETKWSTQKDEYHRFN